MTAGDEKSKREPLSLRCNLVFKRSQSFGGGGEGGGRHVPRSFSVLGPEKQDLIGVRVPERGPVVVKDVYFGGERKVVRAVLSSEHEGVPKNKGRWRAGAEGSAGRAFGPRPFGVNHGVSVWFCWRHLVSRPLAASAYLEATSAPISANPNYLGNMKSRLDTTLLSPSSSVTLNSWSGSRLVHLPKEGKIGPPLSPMKILQQGMTVQLAILAMFTRNLSYNAESKQYTWKIAPDQFARIHSDTIQPLQRSLKRSGALVEKSN